MTKTGLLSLAFIEGGLVMLLETSSPLIVAPIMGNNIIVWSLMISISIGALALGYYLGGFLSKKEKKEELVSYLFLANGVFILLGWLLLYLQNSTVDALATESGSLIIVILALFFPLILFGASTPILVGIIQEKFKANASIVGRVYSLSTAGGILFSLLTGYLFIPEFGLGDTILFGAFITLLSLVIISSVLPSKAKILVYVLLPISLISMKINPTMVDSDELEVLYTSESINGQLVVANLSFGGIDQRILFINRMGQTWVNTKTDASLWPYVPILTSASSIYPKGSNTLVLGLGGGVLPNSIFLYSGHNVDAVELDERIIEISKEFFNLDAGVNVFNEDARRYLESTDKQYDFIVFDIFNGEILPSHCLSLEAFRTTMTKLKKNGVIAINFNGFVNGKTGLPGRSLLKTLHVAGLEVKIFDAGLSMEPENNRNLLYFAYRKGETPDWSKAKADESQLMNKYKVGTYPFFDQHLFDLSTALLITDDRPVMEYINRFAAEEWRKSYIENFTLKFRKKYGLPLTF